MAATTLPDYRINGNKETVHDPVFLHGVFPVPIELVRTVLKGKVVNGKPVGELSPLHPESQFKEFCVDAVQRWLHDMDLRGYKPHTSPDQITVSGPYPPHDWGGVGRASAMHAAGYSVDEIFDFGTVDFRLYGQFIATRRYVNEHDLDLKYKAKGAARGQHVYGLGSKGKPGARTEPDDIMNLIAERSALIELMKRGK